MTALSYLAESMPWVAVGLLVGYLIGRGVRDLDVIAEAVSPEDPMVERPPARRRRWLSRVTTNRILGVVVTVLGLTTVVQGYLQNEATRRVAECTRGYSNGFADALEARSAAAVASQDALDQWMSTLDELMTKVPPDPAAARERFRLATVDYLSKRAEAKKQQQQNPYPPPPRDVCQ